jgi:hypothetical protein
MMDDVAEPAVQVGGRLGVSVRPGFGQVADVAATASLVRGQIPDHAQPEHLLPADTRKCPEDAVLGEVVQIADVLILHATLVLPDHGDQESIGQRGRRSDKDRIGLGRRSHSGFRGQVNRKPRWQNMELALELRGTGQACLSPSQLH